METFGQRIRRLRKERRITQLELAERIGVDFTYVSKIENDRTTRPPAESTIRKIATVLKTDAEELIILAEKVPDNLRQTLVQDTLAVDFLRVVPNFNEEQRKIIKLLIDNVEDKK